MRAANKGSLTEVRRLIGCANVDINSLGTVSTPLRSYNVTGLWAASYKDHLQVVQQLLSNPGIDVNRATTTDGASPLFVASAVGNVDVVKELLAHPQIDVNKATTTTGTTPLFISSQNGHVDVVRLLLADPRVDPNKLRTGGTKNNAINIAAYGGKLEVVKILLRCPKVMLGVEDSNGRTELLQAARKGFWTIVTAIASRDALLEQSHTC